MSIIPHAVEDATGPVSPLSTTDVSFHESSIWYDSRSMERDRERLAETRAVIAAGPVCEGEIANLISWTEPAGPKPITLRVRTMRGVNSGQVLMQQMLPAVVPEVAEHSPEPPASAGSQ